MEGHLSTMSLILTIIPRTMCACYTSFILQILIVNGSGEVVLFGSKAGRTVVHFDCELNETLSYHSVCQFSQ